jgi:hypothetical protein
LCPDIDSLLKDRQLVVVAQKRPEFAAALHDLDEQVAVLDLVRLAEDRRLTGVKHYAGLSW